MSTRGPDYPDELPGRWDGEPPAPHKLAGRYDPGEKYLLERELNDGEAEYQRDLQKILHDEETNQLYHKLDGDLLGLEDGRPGLSLGLGVDGPTIYSDPRTDFKIWAVLAVAAIIFVIFVRGCFGSLEQYDAKHPPPGQALPSAPGGQ